MINERKLAWKYLCKNKSRSISTLFAITLAVFLSVVGGNLIMSAIYSHDQQCLKEMGSHVAYLEEMKTNQIPELEKQGAVVCALENEIYFSGVLGNEEHNMGFEFHFFEEFSEFPYSFEITEGSIPKQPGEMMLDEQWKYFLGENCNIGDTITLQGSELELDRSGQEGEVSTRTFTLAGYYHCPDSSWLKENIVLVKDEERNQNQTYRVYITSKDVGQEDQNEWALKIAESFGVRVKVNYFYQKSETEEAALNYCLILIATAVIGGFAAIVIRNAFVLSVVERTRDYGMLRCVGASKRQIRKIAFYEAVMLGAAGEGIGLILSYLFLYVGMAIARRYFSFPEEFRVVYCPELIVGICFVIFAVVMFSLLEPTRQMNKINPLSALRNQKDVKKEQIRSKGKMGAFVGKIFGVEGEYAYKNLMRNRKKFITMTANSIISIAFFVGVNASFIYSVQRFEEEELKYQNYNADFFFYENDSFSMDSVKEQLNNIDGISNVQVLNVDYYFIDNESLVSKKDAFKTKDIAVVAMDEDKVPIEQESVVEGEVGTLGLGECYVVNWYREEETKKRKELFDVGVKDKIELHNLVFGEKPEEVETISELKVAAVLKEQPIQEYFGPGVMIVSEETFQALCQEQDVTYQETGRIIFRIDETCDVKQVQKLAEKNGMLFYDEMDWVREEKKEAGRVRMAVNVILVLIALISSANLFNSMESNLILREKERNILRAVGMSKKQYRKMIVLEGMLSILVAFVLGTALGLGFGYGIYRLLTISEESLKFAVPGFSILCAGVGLLLLHLISCQCALKKKG